MDIQFVNTKIRLVLYCLSLLITITICNDGGAVYAQKSLGWAPHDKIPDYLEDTEIPPFLIADKNKTVHAFNSQPFDLEKEGSTSVVVYRTWTVDKGWTHLNDIIHDSTGNNIFLLNVYYDEVNYAVHLVMEISGNIYHSSALLALAGNAAMWSQPSLVGQKASSPMHGAIVLDGEGNLVVLYGGNYEGNGLYTVYSEDKGETWSEITPIFLTNDSEHVTHGVQLLKDSNNTIHAVWNVFNENGIGISGRYTQLPTGKDVWSKPMEVDKYDGSGLGIKFGYLAEFENKILLTYYSGDARNKLNTNWWRISNDGGLSWSNPKLLSTNHVGTNGPASVVIDSENRAHLFYGQRSGAKSHGIWHTTWNGHEWIHRFPVVSGPQIVDRINKTGFDPTRARAVMIGGNLLLVTWGTDGKAGSNGGWYSHTIVDSPEIPIEPLPIPTSSPTVIPTIIPSIAPAKATATPTPTTVLKAKEDMSPLVQILQTNPIMPLVATLVSTATIISSLVVIAHLCLNRQR